MEAANKAEQQQEDPHATQAMPAGETVEEPDQPDQPEPDENEEGNGDEGGDDNGDEEQPVEAKKTVPATQSRAGRARAASGSTGQRKRQPARKNGGSDPKAKARLELNALSEQNRKKGHTAPMQKKARELAQIAGVAVPAWAKERGSKSGETPRRESDPDLILAHKATALATGGKVEKDGTLTTGDTKFGAPVNTTQVKAMRDALKGKNVPEYLHAPLTKLRDYAAGKIKGTDLPEEARKRLRELNGKFPSKMKMWARKDAAIAVVLHEERQSAKRKSSAPAKSKEKEREAVPA